VAAAAKELANRPLDSVPRHSVAHFTTDGYAQSGFPTIIGSAEDNEVGGMNFPAGS
jgi:hypothetical protein